MSVLVDDDTRVVVQGITGGEGSFHTEQMLEYGTAVVAGAVPGKGGETEHGVPVYDTVAAAVDAHDADASVVFVPPAFAADALFEALDAELDLVVAITEGVPTQDMARVYRRLAEVDTRLVGPNCPGVITPGGAKLGILPGDVFSPGAVGVVSRSGTLTYQIVSNLTDRGLGQSTAVGIGGDPIIGTDFVDALALFEADPDTEAVVMCGEIGGPATGWATRAPSSRGRAPARLSRRSTPSRPPACRWATRPTRSPTTPPTCCSRPFRDGF